MKKHSQQTETLSCSRSITGKPNSGFTLIELMIVVSIIAIIAAIAIPNLFRSRLTANEGAAIASMRTISSAESQFQASGIVPDATGMGTYAVLAVLGAQAPPFVDGSLALGQKQGYQFVVTPAGAPGAPDYSCNADPLVMGASGNRGFYTDQSGVITYLQGGVAGPADLIVQ